MTKTVPASWAGVAVATLTLATSYLGYGKYEAYQAAAAEPAPAIEVNVNSMPDGPAAVSQNDIDTLIRVAIAAAVRSQDAKNEAKFPKKEAWQ